MKLRHLVGLALSAALPVLAQDYEIRLHRPHRVGEKEKILVVGKESQEMSMSSAGKVMREDKKEFTVELDCVSTVLAISPTGKVTRLSFEVSKLVRKDAGLQKEVLPRGTVVVASKAGRKTVFEVDGNAVAPEVAQALDLVMTVSGSDGTDDELFGTRERKRVGDSWSVNKEAVTQMMSNDPRMAVKDVAGKVTLKEVVKDASGPRLLVTFDVTAKAAPAGATPGVSSQDGTIIMKGTGEFPVDPKLQRTKESMEMDLSTRITRTQNPGNREIEMRMTAKRSMTAKITPVK
jgi:hypothetical protein